MTSKEYRKEKRYLPPDVAEFEKGYYVHYPKEKNVLTYFEQVQETWRLEELLINIKILSVKLVYKTLGSGKVVPKTLINKWISHKISLLKLNTTCPEFVDKISNKINLFYR